jgi:hypothetical protein
MKHEKNNLNVEPLTLDQHAGASVSRRALLEPQRAPLKGKFIIEHRNAAGELVGQYEVPNGIVDEGLNHILDTQFNGGTQVTAWYIGLINNSGYSALSNSDTMGSHAGWVESSAYSESNRPEWTAGSAGSRSITNASTVDFSINATVTIRGIFITSQNTKGGTTGVLWSTAAFGSNIALNNGDTLKVVYTLSG